MVLIIRKNKTEQELENIIKSIIDTILEKSAGVFDRMDVKASIMYVYRQGIEPLQTIDDIEFVDEKIINFVDKFNLIYDYITDYRCHARLTQADVDKLYVFYTEESIWRSLDREHNVRLVEAEIRRFLTMLSE